MTPLLVLLACLALALLLALLLVVLACVRSCTRVLRAVEVALRRQGPPRERIGFRPHHPAPSDRNDAAERVRALDLG